MRFIHTADWHLGRLFHGTHLTDDQAHVLEQLLELVRESAADCVIVAGDVYDRAVPPPDAVKLLDDFLTRLVVDLKTHVLVIAGNHDSPDRLGFASRVLADRGLHIFGSLNTEPHCVTIDDSDGPVSFHAIPYTEPAVARELFDEDTIHSHQAVLKSVTHRIESSGIKGSRSVIAAHAFVAGGEESESERPLSVGGADRISADCFSEFDYVALGHLHRPQRAGSEIVRYSGSLLKYSFSEVDHRKAVNVVEMGPDGRCRVEAIHLAPRYDVRRIEGLFEDIMKGPAEGENREDYLMVSLLDKVPILDVMGRLREIYPNVLHVERPYLTAAVDTASGGIDHRTLTDTELFAAFYEQVTGDGLSSDQNTAYERVVDELRREEREAAP